jgi:uncharacterized membrane protein HdeD (DUF308 family)
MLQIHVEKWWVHLLRGLLALAFGLLALVWPDIGLMVLLVLFGAYVLADGILNVWLALSGRRAGVPWGLPLVTGLAGVAVAALIIIWPEGAAVALLWLIAAWAVVTGVFQVAAAVNLRKQISNEWTLGLSGLLGVLLGVLLVVRPGAGLTALVWLVGLFALLFGVLQVGLALKLKNRQGPASA